MRAGFILLLCAVLCCTGQSQAFFIRSHIPQGKTCNATAGQECFTVMFNKMVQVCTNEPLTFKCIHYNFLDQCFNKRVGYCEASQITAFARHGFQEAHKKCTKLNNKAYREVLPSKMISRQFGDDKTRLSDSQVLATLGYLQTQCSIIQNMSCTSEAMEHVFDNCEHEIRSRTTNPMSNDFDRHKLLRLELDTSRKFLTYMETEERYRCIIVKRALHDIFKIHQEHCFHTIMSRCICERSGFDKRCNINCQSLEVQPPAVDEDEWEHMQQYISRSSASKTSPLSLLIILLINVYINL